MFPSNKLRLLSDENVPKELNKLLSKKFNIKIVPLGAKDNEIIRLAKLEERILLTFDKHFINKIKFPPKDFSGIIFINIHPPLIDTVYFSLSKLFKSIEPSKFKGRLITLTNSGFKIFPRF